VLVTKSMGDIVLKLLDAVEAHGYAECLIAVIPGVQHEVTNTEEASHHSHRKDHQGDGKPHLYINGNPLVNTILVV